MKGNTDSHSANISCYRDYYDKPRWWFRFRYDTQVKKNTCIYLIRCNGKTLREQRVLELGYGSGAVLFAFDPSCEIHGIEVSETALTTARERAQREGYKSFSFQQPQASLPFENASVDIVIASHVLEHVADDVHLIREIHRVLADDGIAVMVVPINETYDDPKHVRRYSAETLSKMVQSAGLVVKQTIENELLYHLVEKFYVEEYNVRWKVAGPIIAGLFNIPASLMPFSVSRGLDTLLQWMGYHPRQVGIVVARSIPVGTKEDTHKCVASLP